MRKRLSLILGSAGFTLIEMMIVVGIIGILVAIAAPNFSRYQSKARQSEAKIALAGIYVAEKTFYSEYNAYAASMDAIGYEPEGFKRFYDVGFSAAHTGSVMGYASVLTTPSWSAVNTSYSCLATTTLPAALSGDAQAFTVGAKGCIRQGAANEDQWNITDQKEIRNSSINL